MDLILDLWVSGRPKTKGSMTHIGGGQMKQSVVGSTGWARLIRDAVRQHIDRGLAGRAGRDSAVRVHCTFFLRQKMGRYVDGVCMPDIAPIWAGAGDSDKLERNVFDALQDNPRTDYVGVMADDVQVTSVRCVSVVAPDDWPVGVHVEVWRMSAADVHRECACAVVNSWEAMRKATVPE